MPLFLCNLTLFLVYDKMIKVIIMKMNEYVLAIKDRFMAEYGVAECSLDYENPLQLLIATQLATQCTDARVNIVMQDLVKKYKTCEDYANADLEELMGDVKPTGFYRNKAKNIIGTCKILLEKYNGEVPSGMEKLTELPGVGRKIANLIRGDVFGIPGIVVDTHCMRLSKRMGLTKETEQHKIEKDLVKKIPKDYQTLFCHQLVEHGRKYCQARKPRCKECILNDICRKKLK